MTLRCRKGDMAIVLNSVMGNEGKMCDVGEFIGTAQDGLGRVIYNVWDISFHGQTHDTLTGEKFGAPDNCLLPIRPGDLDEKEEDFKEIPINIAGAKAGKRIRELLNAIGSER